jgi:hypothetical protein
MVAKGIRRCPYTYDVDLSDGFVLFGSDLHERLVAAT